MTGALSRRQVLIGMTAAVTAGAAGLAVRWARHDTSDPSSSPARTTRPSAPEAALLSVGRQYVADHPDEATPEALRAALGIGGEAATEPSELLARHRTAVRDDLASGRTVDVAGWVLARTEARIAALAALA